MKIDVLILAFTGSAYAQSLAQALSSIPSLSALNGLLASPLVQLPANLSNVTILAPDNQAISSLSNATLQALASSGTLLNQVLSYHVLQGNYSSFLRPTFIPTYLEQNVTRGQRVHAIPGAATDSATFYTGLLSNSSTVNSTVPFNGGSIHIINSFLVPPVNFSSTAIALNLTSIVGATTSTGLSATVDTTPDLTIFVPNNAAFSRISSVFANLTSSELSSILEYHVVPSVLDSNTFSNGSSIETLSGTNVTIRLTNGTFYLDQARIILPNVLTSNGIVHVIDSVLNPGNTTVVSNGNSAVDAFPGAKSGNADTFVSGVPTPTSVINTAAVVGTTSPATTTTPASSAVASSTLGTGAKAGLGVGIALVVILLLGLVIVLVRRRRKSHPATMTNENEVVLPAQLATKTDRAELEGLRGVELDAHANEKQNASRQTRISELEAELTRLRMQHVSELP